MKTFRLKVQKSQINYTSPWYARKIIRRFSPYITRFIVSKTKVSANHVTIWQLIVSLIGLWILCFPNVSIAFIGILFLHLGFIFDCVDGEVARYRKSQSINGMFLDFVNHEIIIPFIYGCFAFHLFFCLGNIIYFYIGLIIILCRFNPVGKARQTTISYLINKADSPTYDYVRYSSQVNHYREETKKSNKTSIMTLLYYVRNILKDLNRYTNAIIVITILLLIELITKNYIASISVTLLVLVYLLFDTILSIYIHLKRRLTETEFLRLVTCCSEIDAKIKDSTSVNAFQK